MARGKICAVAAALVSCACMSPALAHGATVVVDGDDPTPDHEGCGTAANPCGTIQAGVDAAGTGDTVRVGPSAAPYAEAVRIATRDLRLVGPQENVPGEQRGPVPDLEREAIVDAPFASFAAITVAATGVRVDGLWFAGSGATQEEGFAAVEFTAERGELRNNVVVDHSPGVMLAGDHHLVSRNLFVQDETSDSSYGVMATTQLSDLAVRQNRFEGRDDAIVLEGGQRNEGIEIADNTIVGPDGTGVGMDLGGLAAGSNVRGNVVRGTQTGIAVSGADGLRIDRNAISGTAVGITVGQGAGLSANRDVSVVRNQLLDFGDPGLSGGAGLAVADGALATDMVVAANRFVEPAAEAVPAVLAGPQGDGNRVLAANNWWGCNGGAGAEGCTTASGPDVAIAPWLVLSAAAIPSDTPVPGGVRLSADVQRNSAGQDVAEVALLDPLPFEFERVSGPGTLGATASSGGGAAQSAIDSSLPGHTVVRAVLDEATAEVPLEFTAVPPPAAAPVFVDTAPWLRRVRFGPKVFRRGRPSLYFELSEPAVVRVALERMTKGRMSGGRCLKSLRRPREVKCIRQLALGATFMEGAPGANRIPLALRLGGRRLGPGRYRATVTATDAAGNRSPVKLASFTFLPPARDATRPPRHPRGS